QDTPNRPGASGSVDAGAGAGRDHRLEDVEYWRIRDTAPVRAEQAPRFGVAPAGPVLAGHRDAAPGLGRVQRPPAPVHVMLGKPGFDVVPPPGRRCRRQAEILHRPGVVAELADPHRRDTLVQAIPTAP